VVGGVAGSIILTATLPFLKKGSGGAYMKKLIGLIIPLIAMASLLFAALDTYIATRTTVLSPVVKVCTSGTLNAVTNSAVDCIGYKQRGAVTFNIGANALSKNTNFVATIKLQHCDTSSGTFTDVSGLTASISGTNQSSTVSVKEINFQELKRYVRAVYSASNAQDTATNDMYVSFSVVIDGYK